MLYFLVLVECRELITAQTSPSGGLPTTEPSRVERAQAELDNNRRKTMSQTASTLLLRNLHDVFGKGGDKFQHPKEAAPAFRDLFATM
jgi:hypothetical protein